MGEGEVQAEEGEEGEGEEEEEVKEMSNRPFWQFFPTPEEVWRRGLIGKVHEKFPPPLKSKTSKNGLEPRFSRERERER